MDTIRTYLSAHGGLVAGVGLLAFAVYELTVGDYGAAGKAALGALTAFGLQVSTPGGIGGMKAPTAQATASVGPTSPV